jgi:hypothetical protein
MTLIILGWERLLLFGRYSYVEMIKCLAIKTLLFYRLSTGVSILSIYGRLYSEWRIERSVHDLRLQQEILFSNMRWPHSLRLVP